MLNENINQEKNDLDLIVDAQKRILNYLIKILSVVSGKAQPTYRESFIILLGKIRINIEAINTIFPLLHNNPKFKISINLLYRGITEDIINILYLGCFLIPDDSNQISLGNELNILHKEFLVSIIDAFRAKIISDEKIYNSSNDIIANAKDSISKIIQDNPNLVNEKGKGKNNSIIRAGTNDFFQEKINKIPGANSNVLSSNFKLRYIEECDYDRSNQLKYLSKYYTQFQHYSLRSNFLIHGSLSIDIANYVGTIQELLLVLPLVLQLIVIDDAESFNKELNDLIGHIINSFKITTNSP